MPSGVVDSLHVVQFQISLYAVRKTLDGMKRYTGGRQFQNRDRSCLSHAL